MLLRVCDAGARAVERRWGGGLIGETIVVGVEVGQGQPLEATLTKLADMSLRFVHVVRAKIAPVEQQKSLKGIGHQRLHLI